MAPTFCKRCKDEGCGLSDELAEPDSSPERLLERYDLKSKINRFHSPIVRQLPPDVMSTIFEFCLTYFADHQFSSILSFAKEDLSIPLPLGAICSYWREIAWSTPTLWSSLVVRVSSKHDPQMINSITQEWLARSGQLPLSICILSTSTRDDQIQALTNIINQYASRWSNLDLYIYRYHLKYFHATGSAPILKSVRLHGVLGLFKLDFPLTCPRLERVNLTNLNVNGNNISWDSLTHLTLLYSSIQGHDVIQWSNLTHLSIICSMTISEIFRILRKTPRLVFCRISRFGPEVYEEHIGAPVLTLASLRSLRLITSHAEDVLNYLIAPHLEELSLPKYYYQLMDISMEVIASFLKRSAIHGSLRVLQVELERQPTTRIIPKNGISYVSSLVEQGAIVSVLTEWDDITLFTNSLNTGIWAVIVYQFII